MVTFPNCKINLGLHVLNKRADGFHDLDTVFYPLPLQDGLEIIQNPITGATSLAVSGLSVDGDLADNICMKAYDLLKKDFPGLPAVQIHLHKCIPTGAGLGGGSADGAFTLLLLIKKFRLELTEARLLEYALRLGSDCPFFIWNKPCFAGGRGEKLEPMDLDLSGYKMVLINPGIHINTGWAFSQIRPDAGRPSLKSIIQRPINQWKGLVINDFEGAVFQTHPGIREIKDELYAKGAIYASMTGSGSSVFGLFEKKALPALNLPSSYFIKYI